MQIIGNQKNKDTLKAIRFLKERRIDFAFVDLKERLLSKREWESIVSSVSDKNELIDFQSAYYKKNGYSWRDFDPVEEVIMHPELLRLPVIRNGRHVVVGYDEARLKEALCTM